MLQYHFLRNNLQDIHNNLLSSFKLSNVVITPTRTEITVDPENIVSFNQLLVNIIYIEGYFEVTSQTFDFM